MRYKVKISVRNYRKLVGCRAIQKAIRNLPFHAWPSGGPGMRGVVQESTSKHPISDNTLTFMWEEITSDYNEEETARVINHAVWGANEQWCEVTVSLTRITDVPTYVGVATRSEYDKMTHDIAYHGATGE